MAVQQDIIPQSITVTYVLLNKVNNSMLQINL